MTSQLGLAGRVNTIPLSMAHALHLDALDGVLKSTTSLLVGLWLYSALFTLISRPTVFTDEVKNKIKLFTFTYKLVSLIRQFQTGESDFSLITPISLWGRLFEFWRAIIDSHTGIYEEKLGPEIVLCQCQITFEHCHQLIICAHKRVQAAGIIDNYSHNCPSKVISKSPVGNHEYIGNHE